ncbi:hypothetical protein BCV69DRAFT_280441 [Microstroma glucosiphilum]|uniref:HAD-like protein n=1 Tax=Pseudomicrostroma glucosiphilum TaxID=1684307 RepID=A0A316UFZ8_9BASI|nr:hypothetical protein BCV69DRAFT_280441 [Pseudomicrostroma glucosiphilum]PWN22833.1 hypothetical protein BCV69DRAFT_280441 [Pseudomicrostroma glucosiphilum]
MTDAPNPLPPVKKQLIVFDFDWSLADQDSDRWVHEALCPRLRRKMKELKPTMQFTDLCAMLLRELHDVEGKTEEEIKAAMRLMPFHPGMKRGVQNLKAAASPETTFFLLSNSNTVYIDTILEHQGLTNIFDEIVTNPAHFEKDGTLNVSRRVPAEAQVQHTCKVGCSANMCKGEELDAFLSRHGGYEAFDRIMYVGDGGNDFCPVLRLRKGQDVAFVRRYRGLEKRIKEEGGVKCGIRWWAGAWEMEGLLDEARAA